ncbi:MAG: hypothetical protein IKP28_03700 [Clostridia bacterium]|nr:hypothetical protein [Clostridia bacterium]
MFGKDKYFNERYCIAEYITMKYGVYTIPEDVSVVARGKFFTVLVEGEEIVFHNDNGKIYEMANAQEILD